MPVHRVKGGFKWGSHGHVFKTRGEAEAQGRAAYADGYRGDNDGRPGPEQERQDAPARMTNLYTGEPVDDEP